MENNKITFTFGKVAKKPALIRQKSQEKEEVELIESIEGQNIILKNKENEIEDKPLIIPLKDDAKNLLDRVRSSKGKSKQSNESSLNKTDNRPDSELSLDELAAREIIKDAKKREGNEDSDNKSYSLPLAEDKLVIEGEKEPTLDDYESVPIEGYGLAMLRGMGWKEGMGIGKDPTKSVEIVQPQMRPKGLGLGALDLVKDRPKEVVDKDGKELVLKSGTCAKIVAGRYKGQYCQVQGIDEDGNVTVKTTLKGETLILSEILLTPVTKDEYTRLSKVLNIEKYEASKKNPSVKTEGPLQNLDRSSDTAHRKSGERSEYKVEKTDEPSKSHRHTSDSDSDNHKNRERKSKSGKSNPETSRGSASSSCRPDKSKSKPPRVPSSDSSDSEFERRERRSSYKHKGKSKYRDKSRSRSGERYYRKKLSRSAHRRRSSSESSDDRHHHQGRPRDRGRARSSSNSDSDYRSRHRKK